jgi:hypothetical protein
MLIFLTKKLSNIYNPNIFNALTEVKNNTIFFQEYFSKAEREYFSGSIFQGEEFFSDYELFINISNCCNYKFENIVYPYYNLLKQLAFLCSVILNNIVKSQSHRCVIPAEAGRAVPGNYQ